MRIAIRFLAVLTLLALVAPQVRWVAVRTDAGPCACPPEDCMCPEHHHALGHTPHCGMASGGQCGLDSPDAYLSSLLNAFIYMPTEHLLKDPLQVWDFGDIPANLILLPSHAQLPEQPPRVTL